MSEIDKLLEEPSQEVPKIAASGVSTEGDAVEDLTSTASNLAQQLRDMSASFDATNPYSTLRIPNFTDGSVTEDAFSRKKFVEQFGDATSSNDENVGKGTGVALEGVKRKGQQDKVEDDEETVIDNAESVEISAADMNAFASAILVVLLALYYTIIRVGNVISTITIATLQKRILKYKLESEIFAALLFALVVAESARIAFAAGNTVRIISGIVEVLILIPIITLIITICYMEGRK